MAVTPKEAAQEAARLYGVEMPPPRPHTNGAGPSAPEDSGEAIVWVGGQHRDEVDAALRALIDYNNPPSLFTRGGIIVRLKNDDDGRQIIQIANEATIRLSLSRAALFLRGKAAVTPPKPTVEGILAHENPGLPTLAGISTIPVFRPDGSIHDRPGYDPKTRVVYIPAPGFAISAVPDLPGAADIERARNLILKDLLGDFPFDGRADLANAVSLLFERPLRPIIEGLCPLHIFDKPQRGTGASLLLESIWMVNTGSPAPMRSYTADENEMRKAITSAHLAGSELIAFDNVEGTFSSAQLAKALTETVRVDRLMTTMRDVVLQNRASWAATGNNLNIAGDLGRRTCLTRLNARHPHPYLRTKFLHRPLLEWVKSNRSDLVWAVLVLARSWLAAGRPAGPLVTLGGYESWANTMSGVLAHAGIPGFMENALTVFEASESEAETWAAFVAVWYQVFGSTPTAAAAVAKSIEDQPGLWASVVPDLGDAKRSLSSRLGYRLRKFANVVFSTGFELRKTGLDQRTRQVLWSVAPVELAKDAPTETGKTDTNAKDAKNPQTPPRAPEGVRAIGEHPSQSFDPSQPDEIEWEEDIVE